MRSDAEKIEAIESQHNHGCDSYDSCGCFDRLLACIRGEPDPEGQFYRWPILDFNVKDPRIAQWRAMGRTDFTITERLMEAMLQDAEDRMQHIVSAGPPVFDFSDNFKTPYVTDFDPLMGPPYAE